MAEAYLTRRTARVKRGEVLSNSTRSLTIPDLGGMKNAVISYKSDIDLNVYMAAALGFRQLDTIEIIIEDGEIAHIVTIDTDQSGAPSLVRLKYSASPLIVSFDASTGTINLSTTHARFVTGATYKYIVY